jgi:hypothetical protein
MEFEWDSEKELYNIKHHGISFGIAKKVFNDNFRLEIYDDTHSIYEDRYNTIGLVEEILFVVYTERKEKIRIISARIATEHERRIYYDNLRNIK